MVRQIKKQGEKDNINKLLIDNFVNLQGVLTELAVRIETMTQQTSKLLQLFEVSAKSFTEKQRLSPSPEHLERARELRDREFAQKMDKLLDENKTIAKGITLIEEKIHENISKEKEILKDIDDKAEEFKPRNLPHI